MLMFICCTDMRAYQCLCLYSIFIFYIIYEHKHEHKHEYEHEHEYNICSHMSIIYEHEYYI
jgi:hypothetical protein